MDIIYALARKVHVWLGPATDEEIDSVWPIFRTGDPEPGFSFMDEAYITIFHQTQDKKVWSRCSDETTSFSLCVKKFFHRAWFTRRWILQEVSLAREVIVHCGFHEVPWVRFHQGAHFHRSLLDSGQRKHGVCSFATVARQALETIESMETSRAQKKDYFEGMERNPYHGIKRVLWLLEQYHRANCVDERDRLYALYGLLLKYKTSPSTSKTVDASMPSQLQHSLLAHLYRFCRRCGKIWSWFQSSRTSHRVWGTISARRVLAFMGT